MSHKMMCISWEGGVARLVTPANVIAYRKAQTERTLRRIARKGMENYERDTELPLLGNFRNFVSLDSSIGDGYQTYHDIISEVE